MTRRTQPDWPTWKIVVVAVVCALAGTAFFVGYAYLPSPAAASQPTPDQGPARGAGGVGLTNIIVLFGLLGWTVALVFLAWGGYRMYRRIPAWRRRQMFGRGR